MGNCSFESAQYHFLGEFKIIDIYLTSSIVTLILVLFVSVPILFYYLIKKKILKILPLFLSVFFVMLSYFLIFDVGLKSEYINTEKTFEWSSPEYEVVNDAYIKHKPIFFEPIKTGIFEKGTKLYANGESKVYNDVMHYEVTDGKRVGYVSIEVLEPLVEYEYIINENTKLFDYEEEKVMSYDFLEKTKEEVTLLNPTYRIVCKVKKNTVVEITRTKVKEYIMIRLKNGKKGFVKEKYVDEIRKEKNTIYKSEGIKK